VTEKVPPEGPGDDDDDGRGFHDPHDPEADGSAFDDLDDAEKVKFCEAEVASALAKLDDAIARLAALRTEVEDPDGLVRFTLGEDGRLLSLFIHDAATASLTNLGLEQKLNGLFAAGNDVMRLARKEYWGDLQP
jgi:hypothetical protein